MEPTGRQGETTKGSEHTKTSFGPTVAKEMQTKATVMSFSRLSDRHTQRLASSGLCGSRSPILC